MGLAIIIPNVDFSSSGLGKVELTDNVILKSISIVADDEYEGQSAKLGISYFPLCTTQRSVLWSIVSGGEFATIDNEGNLSISESASLAKVTVRATSLADKTIYGEKEITISFARDITIKDGYAIESDGIAYINATKYFGASLFNYSNTNFKIKFEIDETYTEARSIFGLTEPNVQMLHLVNLANSEKLRLDEVSHHSTPTYSDDIIGKIVNYTRTEKEIELSIEGTTTSYTSSHTTDISEQYDFYLFALNNGGLTANNIAKGVKIYSASLSLTDGTKVFDLVPCEKNGIYGMFDQVSMKPIFPDNGTFSLTE